jgi:UDP-N-acetylmuramyl pentapeptide phosphotransferase/UDP-N-acetylglucosamine-1-phosphate transferase
MAGLLAAFFLSALTTLWVIRTAHKHSHLSADAESSGPQKFHQGEVPRVGGVGILVGIAVSALALYLLGWDDEALALKILLCALPAFGAGLWEDLTKQVSPAKRLLASALSGGLGCAMLGATLSRTDIPGLDALMVFPVFAVMATVFTVAGVANALNIIDGFNGLASMCAMLMLAAFAGLSFVVGDLQLMRIGLISLFAVAGFFIWNYPRGLIFLGDGGAYLLGFLVAEIGILLVVRHPQMSPLVALMVCIYPVFETVFSIYRRRFLRAVPPGLPDGIHLHSLIYRRLVRWAAGPRDARGMAARNSAVSPFLWILCLTSIAPALAFWDNSALLGACIVIFALVYIGVYWRIVRFKTPLIFKGPKLVAKIMMNQPAR